MVSEAFAASAVAMRLPPRSSRSPSGVPAPRVGPGDRHAAHHTLLFPKVARSRSFWVFVGLLLLAGAAVAAVFFFTDLELAQVTRWIGGLNPLAVIPLMAVLPVFGFPIAVVYLVAGARFGPAVGGLIVAAATAFHLLATHAVARSFLRGPIVRFIARRRRTLPQIPPDEHAAVALIAALAPGLPYFLRNYLLALSGIRLRVYFSICLPVYVARSYVTILLGDLSSDPSRRGLFILVGIDVIKISICALVIWWLRRHHRRVHGAGGAGSAADARLNAAGP
jgi:uncharacterized membrane protein YdjX (TVP38/TMEM64 family)